MDYVKWANLVAMAILVGGTIVSFAVGRKTLAAGLMLIVALWIGLNLYSYLPFLGPTVMPCSLLANRIPEHADTEVRVDGLTPGATVMYWAAEPSLGKSATDGLARIKDWRQAYLDFANAGVTRADDAGVAVFVVRKPQPYTVPIRGRLESHVHWRVCEGHMLGPVQTTMLAL
uniref:Uncharacterized protein n=1 Tax=viral metagenome TaxID=1070528 RepID=A0A6C0E6Y9_9ZZZZ